MEQKESWIDEFDQIIEDHKELIVVFPEELKVFISIQLENRAKEIIDDMVDFIGEENLIDQNLIESRDWLKQQILTKYKL